jgi:hypothetical protein
MRYKICVMTKTIFIKPVPKILLCRLGIRKKNLLCAQSAMTRKITFKTDKSLPDKNTQ